jgi:hypothetical protein
MWTLANNQYDDLAGASERILFDEDDRPAINNLEMATGLATRPASLAQRAISFGRFRPITERK